MLADRSHYGIVFCPAKIGDPLISNPNLENYESSQTPVGKIETVRWGGIAIGSRVIITDGLDFQEFKVTQ